MKREKAPKLERHTARPVEVYRIATRESQGYVAQFSRSLGLKPASTLFGKRRVKV